MLKLNVGFSRKVGEANYGSRGASVNLELEVESGLANEPDTLRERVKQLFRMARASVDEELNGGQASNVNGYQGNGRNGHHSNGQHNGTNGSNSSRRSNGRSATQSQIRAIHAIVNRQRLDLTAELRDRFGVERPDDLTIGEASELIDAIKPQTNGNGARR